MRIAIAALTLAALAGSAHAQCNAARYGIPDFDQRRSSLPGQGAMYCVPTAVLNLMGYIANHGQPQALSHSSPDWSSFMEYSLVSARDMEMGQYMKTDPVKGTTGGSVSGCASYMNYYNVGPAVIYGYYNTKDFQISPGMMWTFLNLNWPTSMCFGRYQWDTDHWKRTGGHCLTVCAVSDICSSNPSVGFKDPNTNPNTESIMSQSAFKTGWWNVTKQGHTFSDGFFKMWGPDNQSGNDTLKYIDCMLTILPLFALTQDEVPGPGGLALYTLPFLNNDTQPPTQHIGIPGGASVRFADIDPRTMDLILVGDPTTESPARLWKYSRQDGSVTPLLDLPGVPDSFTIDRQGDILAGIGGDLYKYHSLEDGSLRQDSQTRLGLPLIKVVISDWTDDVYVLSGRTLLKFPGGNLGDPPSEGTLPADFVPADGESIAINPVDGMPWVCSPASDSIRQVVPGATGGWDFGLLVPAVEPSGLQFGDHGEIKFLSKGGIVELDLGPEGRYIPAERPQFRGLPASKFLVLGRSRTNFDARIHTGPAWDNIDEAPVEAEETLDCLADVDFNGFVNGDDFDTFARAFDAGDIAADIDNNGFVNGDDFDAFAYAFDHGC